MHPNYWAFALEPRSHGCWSLWTCSLGSTIREVTTMRSPHTATREKPMQPRRPSTAKNKYDFKKKKKESQEPSLQNHTIREVTTMRSPHTATREKPTQQWRPSTAKNKYDLKKRKKNPRNLFKKITAGFEMYNAFYYIFREMCLINYKTQNTFCY